MDLIFECQLFDFLCVYVCNILFSSSLGVHQSLFSRIPCVLASSVDYAATLAGLASCSAEKYVLDSGRIFCVTGFVVMSLLWDTDIVHDVRYREDRLTAAGTWVNKWKHWGGRRTSEGHCSGRQTDSPFVCFQEEVAYETRFVALVVPIPPDVDNDSFRAGSRCVSKGHKSAYLLSSLVF